MIRVLLVLILLGGVFIRSGLFQEYLNRPKSFFLLITTLLLLFVCFVSRNGIRKTVCAFKSRTFFNGVAIVCLLVTVHGLLQYFGILPSYHRLFAVTGSFENPAGFAAVQAAMFPFVFTRYFDKECGRFLKIFSIVVSVLCATSVILAGSRTGFIAICAAIAVVLAYTDAVSSLFKAHRWLWLLLVVIAVVSAILLYHIKKDSADGRVFIWNRCLELVKERPLFGYGRYGFHGHYMPAQADYFRAHPDSPYVMIADNVTTAFNEYLKLTVNYGLVGLAVAIALFVLIVRRLFKCDKQTKVLGLSFIASMFIMCQFSYPYMYGAVWLLSLIAIVPAFVDAGKEVVIPPYARIIISSLLFIALGLSLRTMYYEMKWTEIAKRSIQGRAGRMMPYYEDVERVIGKNPLFLYNYAAELNAVNNFQESLDILTLCSESWNEYNVQNLYIDNYFKMGQLDNALKACDEAYYMAPSRFGPLYRKMLIYIASNDTINAIHMANKILDKPVKIQSEELDRIISAAEGLLSHYEDEQL